MTTVVAWQKEIALKSNTISHAHAQADEKVYGRFLGFIFSVRFLYVDYFIFSIALLV